MDIYKIGVEIALAGNIEAALGALGKHFLGLQGDVDKVGKSIKGWGDAIKGVAAIAAGAAIFGGLKDLISHGSELIHVQQQLAATGVSQVDATRAQGEAWRVSAKYGLEVAKVLSDIKEAQMVFGSTGHAIDFIDPLEKMRVVLNGVTEGSGSKASDAVYEMARAGELKGLQGADQFTQYFEGMTKAITASGGKVTPQAFMQATQYGKLSSKGWDEEFYTKYFPSMIQEMRPSTAGQSLMSLYGTLAQGKASKRSIINMMDLGLIGDPSKIIHGSGGDPTGMNPGAVVGTDELIKNPFAWAQKYLRPLMEKKLGHEIQAGDQQAIALLGGMFGNRNSAAAIASLLLESPRITKDAGMIGQAKGLGAADQLLAHDPTTVMNNFNASWSNLLTSLGAPLVEPALHGLNAFAGAMKSLTAVFAAHPDAVRNIGMTSAAVGAMLTAYGTAKIGGMAYNILSGKGGLMGSAVALDRSALMLSEAAVALGAKGVGGGLAGGAGLGILSRAGIIGAAITAGAGALWGWKSLADAYEPQRDPSRPQGGRGAGARLPWWNAPSSEQYGPFQPSGAQGGRGAHNQPITVNPQIQATTNVTIDGKSVAAAILPMIIKQIGNLIPHPTSAPMFSGSNFPYSADSSMGNR